MCSSPEPSERMLASRGKSGWLATRAEHSLDLSRSNCSASQNALPPCSDWQQLNGALLGNLLLFSGTPSRLPVAPHGLFPWSFLMFFLCGSLSDCFSQFSWGQRPFLNHFLSSDRDELCNHLVAQFVGYAAPSHSMLGFTYCQKDNVLVN